MEITNLRDKDVSALQGKIEELKEDNPGIMSRVFSMAEEHGKTEEPNKWKDDSHIHMQNQLDKIEKKVNLLLIHFGLAKEDILVV